MKVCSIRAGCSVGFSSCLSPGKPLPLWPPSMAGGPPLAWGSFWACCPPGLSPSSRSPLSPSHLGVTAVTRDQPLNAPVRQRAASMPPSPSQGTPTHRGPLLRAGVTLARWHRLLDAGSLAGCGVTGSELTGGGCRAPQCSRAALTKVDLPFALNLQMGWDGTGWTSPPRRISPRPWGTQASCLS